MCAVTETAFPPTVSFNVSVGWLPTEASELGATGVIGVIASNDSNDSIGPISRSSPPAITPIAKVIATTKVNLFFIILFLRII